MIRSRAQNFIGQGEVTERNNDVFPLYDCNKRHVQVGKQKKLRNAQMYTQNRHIITGLGHDRKTICEANVLHFANKSATSILI